MRWLGMIILIVALVVAVFDIIHYVGAGGDFPRAVGDWWFRLHSDSLLIAQPAIERHVLPALWDPVILTILQWPLAIVLAAIGVVFILLGQRRRRKRRLIQ